MSLKISCRADELMAYMRFIISTYGKDCLVVDLNPIVPGEEVSVNAAELCN